MRVHRKQSRAARPPRLALCLLLLLFALTAQPAAAIANAAQQWGQEDDITVLTVARTFSLNEVTA